SERADACDGGRRGAAASGPGRGRRRRRPIGRVARAARRRPEPRRSGPVSRESPATVSRSGINGAKTMWLVMNAMRRPVTLVVAVVSIVPASAMAIQRMKVDIFPQLGAPAIYVAQPYGGMDPAQMEGYLTYYYEYHFLYITGIEHVESKNIQ